MKKTNGKINYSCIKKIYCAIFGIVCAGVLFFVVASSLQNEQTADTLVQSGDITQPISKSRSPKRHASAESPSYITGDEYSGNLIRPPLITNFLFVGLDNNQLADAIMVGSFHRESGQVNLMSVPRDMYTVLPEHRLNAMREDGLKPPQILKINAIRAFGGKKHGMKHLKAQLSEMLGVSFHHYVEADLTAFKGIVDAIGGVTMYIPRDMYYTDPVQGLTINIPKGEHHLNGAMAEHVVRYRSYPTGDLMRNNIQMEFMATLLKQALTKDAILNDPMALATTILSQVRTSASVIEMARYLPYISKLKPEKIESFTMPGNGEYIDGVSWFIPSEDKLQEVVNKVFMAH